MEIEHLPKNLRDEVIVEVGELLVDQVLAYTSDGSSPVQGESYKRTLSKEYKAKKVAAGGQPFADLELSGDLKSSLGFKPTKDGLEIGFYGPAAPKADGHLNFSGKSELPQRRVLPGEDQNFRRDIVKEVQQIIADKTTSLFNKGDFADVETSKDLYDVFREQFDSSSKSEIRLAVAGNPELLDLLSELDLLRLL